MGDLVLLGEKLPDLLERAGRREHAPRERQEIERRRQPPQPARPREPPPRAGETSRNRALPSHRQRWPAQRRYNLQSRTLIREGQVLRIPVSGLPPAAAPPAGVKPGDTVTYVVKAGDTLSSLSRMFSTTVEKIKAANNLASDELVVGQKLTITVGR
jgi:nucleoid-associated protein YgaU